MAVCIRAGEMYVRKGNAVPTEPWPTAIMILEHPCLLAGVMYICAWAKRGRNHLLFQPGLIAVRAPAKDLIGALRTLKVDDLAVNGHMTKSGLRKIKRDQHCFGS